MTSKSGLLVLSFCLLALIHAVSVSGDKFTYLMDEHNIWPGSDLHPYVCSPSGLQTAVPINSTFSGLGIFRYNDENDTLSWTIYHNAGTSVLFTQISVGAKGQFKGPSYILNNTNPIVGYVHLNKTLEEPDRLKNGTLYFELRTTKNPDGELRCQIVKNVVNATAEFASMLFPPSVVNATRKYNESFSLLNGTMYATYNFSTNLLIVKVMHNLPFARNISLFQGNHLINRTICNTTKCNITLTLTHNSTERALLNDNFFVEINNNITYLAANIRKIDSDERNALCDGPCFTYEQTHWDLNLVDDLFNPRRDDEQVFLSVGSGLNTLNTTCYQCIYPFNSTFSSIGVYTFNKTSKVLSWFIFQTAGNQTIFNQISQGGKGSFRVPTFVLGTTNVTSPLIGSAVLNKTLITRLHNATLYHELRTIIHPDGELRGQITNNTANFTAEFAGIMRHPDPLFGRINGTVYGQYNFTTNTILVKVIHNLPIPRNISLVWLNNNHTLNMSLCNTTKCNISLTIDHMRIERALIHDEIVVVVNNQITYIATKLYKTDLDVRIPFDPTLDTDQILAIALFSAATVLCVLIGLTYRMWRWYKLYKAGKAYMIVPHIIREMIACGKESKAYFSKKGRRGLRKTKKEAIRNAAHTMNQDMGHAVDPIVEDLREDVK